MDFLKLVRSLEELIFEAMAWLIYYPRTMWLVVRHPLRMVDYSDHEQRVDQEEPYADTMSPPLFLLLTILLAHALALSVATIVQHDEAAVTKKVFGSDQNLVLARSLGFAVFPLMAAVAYVRRTGKTLARKNLRPPFFGQCYLAAPYTLAVSVAVLAMEAPSRSVAYAGDVLLGLATIFYLGVQTAQYRRCLALRAPRAIGLSMLVFVEALVVVSGIGIVAISI